MLLSLKFWNYKYVLILCMFVNYKVVKCSFFVELMIFYYRMCWLIVLFNLNWIKYYRNLIINWYKGNNIFVYRELFNLIVVRCCLLLFNNSSGNYFLGKEEWEKEKKWWVLNMEREKLIIRLNEKFFEKL